MTLRRTMVGTALAIAMLCLALPATADESSSSTDFPVPKEGERQEAPTKEEQEPECPPGTARTPDGCRPSEEISQLSILLAVVGALLIVGLLAAASVRYPRLLRRERERPPVLGNPSAWGNLPEAAPDGRRGGLHVRRPRSRLRRLRSAASRRTIGRRGRSDHSAGHGPGSGWV